MALTSTTLSLACTSTDTLLTVGSTVGVVRGALLGIESEILTVAGLTGVGTQVRVLRGVNGTSGAPHAAAVTVSVGTPQDFATASQNIVIAPSGSVLMGQGPGAPPAYSTVGGTLSLTYLTVSGNVGIGTTSPTPPFGSDVNALQVVGSITSNDVVYTNTLLARTSGGELTIGNGSGAFGLNRNVSLDAAVVTNGVTRIEVLSTGEVGIGTTSPDAQLDVVKSALAATSTDGIILQNETASTAGATVQMSPRLMLKGRAWNSSGSVDETSSFFLENLPATAAGTITGTLKVGYRNNAGTVTYPFTVSSAGAVACLGALTLTNITLNGIRILTGYGTGQLAFTDPTQTVGVGIDVSTDAVLKLRDRAQTGGATLDLLEQTAPTGVANTARIYARDNGAGKTQLMVIFGSGAAQQIAIEP